MTKKILLPMLLAFAASLSTMAQGITNGFYRVNNCYTQRYVYVYDNYGSINVSTTSADMGAIVLQKDAALRFDDPASVIYVSNKGKYNTYDLYDLEAQGTGVHKIISYYVTIVKNSTNKFSVYEPSHSMYLYDGKASTAPRSYMQTSKPSGASNDIGYWSIYPVNASTDEYLGITPHENLKVGNKYYKPYYLGFAFDFASAGMKAYYISEIKSDAVIISEVTGTVPANTPVIVECSSTNSSSNRINLYATSPAKISDNKLSGNFFCYEGHATSTSGYKEYNPSTMRLLSVVNGKLTYITDNNVAHHTTLIWKSGGKETKRLNCLNANESYLTVPAGTAASLPVMTKEEYAAAHPVHNHTWSTSWTHNDTHHWHTCTTSGCSITNYATCGEAGAAYGVHTYGTTGNSRFTCVCGYVDETKKSAAELEDLKNNHQHAWSSSWEHNDTHHWHTCTADYCSITDYATCGQAGAAYGTHSYGTEGDSRFTCVCGYVDTTRKAAALLADNKAAFAQYQSEQKAYAETLAEDGDPDEISSLIVQAQQAIDALSYDEKRTLAENKAAVDAIINKLKQDIALARDPSGIYSTTDELLPTIIYDLSGRQATEQRGIRIRNGRKEIR